MCLTGTWGPVTRKCWAWGKIEKWGLWAFVSWPLEKDLLEYYWVSRDIYGSKGLQLDLLPTKDIFSVLGLRILFVVCCHSLNSNLYSDNSARTWWVSRGWCQNSRGIWIKFSKLTQLGIRRVIWVTGGLALQTFNNFWLWMINWELMFDQTQVELHCPFSVLTSTRCTLAIFWGALFAMFAIT